MRIALIAPPWVAVPPLAYGGTERVVHDLAAGLDEQGHDVTVFARRESVLPKSVRVITPLPLRPEWENPVDFEVGWVAAARDHVERSPQRFDVIHDHTRVGKIAASGSTPVLTTMHWVTDDLTAPTHRAAATTSKVVAVSQSQMQLARAQGVRTDFVIPHGIRTQDIEMGRGDGGYILFAGRMDAKKGADIAARMAHTSGMRLILASPIHSDFDQRFFDIEVKPYIGSNVTHVGEMPHSDLIELMRGASVLLNPLQWDEPFGLVMVEALAAGTPLVVTGRGSSSEIVDARTGVICTDERELALACMAAKRLSRQACRDRAETVFSAERMVADHVSAYESLARSTDRAYDAPVR